MMRVSDAQLHPQCGRCNRNGEMPGGGEVGRAGNKVVSFTIASAVRAIPIDIKCT